MYYNALLNYILYIDKDNNNYKIMIIENHLLAITNVVLYFCSLFFILYSYIICIILKDLVFAKKKKANHLQIYITECLLYQPKMFSDVTSKIFRKKENIDI